MSRENRESLRADVGNEFRYLQPVFDEMDDVVGEYLGLNRTDLRVIDFASRGAAVTAGELARQSGLSTGAVTAVIDRLEKVGWLRRLRDPDDRRRVLVEVPPEKVAESWEIYRPLKERGDESMKHLTLDQLRLLRDTLRSSREITEERIRELREEIRRRGGDAAA
jgi:DNA-binding MarR family transcriptional regulator